MTTSEFVRVNEFFGVVAKLVAAIPFFGLSLALAHEYSFLWGIGIDAAVVLELTDIARASLVYIVPIVPLAIIGITLGRIRNAKFEPAITRERPSVKRPDLFEWLLVSPFLISASGHFLLGIAPNLAPGSYGVTVAFLGYVFLPNAKFLGGALTELKILIWVFFMSIVLSASYGASRAASIFYTDVERLPQVEPPIGNDDGTTRLIRRFSGGVITTSDELRSIQYFAIGNDFSVSFRVDDNRWQGALCEWFDICQQE